MNIQTPLLLLLALFHTFLVNTSAAQSFDFFYFVQLWPGSHCATRRSCCYPSAGKPATDFGIHGLWPNYNNGSYPSSCDPDSQYDQSKIEDLISAMQENWPSLICPSENGTEFWTDEWKEHGTCSESILDQHAYFKSALNIKKQLNLLKTLTDAGINPDGRVYSLDIIKDAIKKGTGFTPGIECYVDKLGNNQLYQVYMCVDTSGSQLIECPVYPMSKCGSNMVFPTF